MIVVKIKDKLLRFKRTNIVKQTITVKPKKKYIYFKFKKKKLRQAKEYIEKYLKERQGQKLNKERWKRIEKTAQLLFECKTPEEIASILNINISTIKSYLSNIDYIIQNKLKNNLL